MRKALLMVLVSLGLIAVVALIVHAQAADPAAATGQQHTGKGNRPAPIVVDPAKNPELAKAIETLKKTVEKAIADAQTQAVKDLGDADGKRLIAQTLREAMQPLMPPGMMGGKGKSGKGGGAPKAPAPTAEGAGGGE